MSVITAVGLANLVLGLAYTGLGVMTIVEMRRDRHTFGFSPIGLAWIFMAFTCGPHHLAHGIHVLFEDRQGGPVDLLSVVIGLPVGVFWLGLRVEAFVGGRGDRYVRGTPTWLRWVPVLAIAYVGALLVALVRSGPLRLTAALPSSLLLIWIYLAIGYFFGRTQLANRPAMGGWSVSGLCLTAIFPTCAVMHAVWAVYVSAGAYHHDVHAFVIDWLSVPAGIYFLWVVRGLYNDAISDWNDGPDEVVPADFLVTTR